MKLITVIQFYFIWLKMYLGFYTLINYRHSKSTNHKIF